MLTPASDVGDEVTPHRPRRFRAVDAGALTASAVGIAAAGCVLVFAPTADPDAPGPAGTATPQAPEPQVIAAATSAARPAAAPLAPGARPFTGGSVPMTDGRPELRAAPPPAGAQEPAPAPDPDAERRRMWERLADCESGVWDRDGRPIPGSHRWDYGLRPSHGAIYEGGVHFHPATWDGYRDPGMPDHAGHATSDDQIVVAERVLADQGWGAWPVCSRKLGLRN